MLLSLAVLAQQLPNQLQIHKTLMLLSLVVLAQELQRYSEKFWNSAESQSKSQNPAPKLSARRHCWHGDFLANESL
jgi:hypothetical protein